MKIELIMDFMFYIMLVLIFSIDTLIVLAVGLSITKHFNGVLGFFIALIIAIFLGIFNTWFLVNKI